MKKNLNEFTNYMNDNLFANEYEAIVKKNIEDSLKVENGNEF